jgi:hypothetical protein
VFKSTPRYKTLLCRDWEGGYCRHGMRCNRAHGFSELRMVMAEVILPVRCVFRCWFAHQHLLISNARSPSLPISVVTRPYPWCASSSFTPLSSSFSSSLLSLSCSKSYEHLWQFMVCYMDQDNCLLGLLSSCLYMLARSRFDIFSLVVKPRIRSRLRDVPGNSF